MNSYIVQIGTNLSIKGPCKSIMMYNAVNSQTWLTISGILKESYRYHSRVLIIVNEVLATAGLWNSLLNEIKLNEFKNKLKNHTFGSSFT